MAFARPAERLRTVVSNVRTLLTGQPANLETVPGARPLRLEQAPVPELPIWIAAMGTRAVSVAAELADGWFPSYVMRERFAAWVPELTGVREAGDY